MVLSQNVFAEGMIFFKSDRTSSFYIVGYSFCETDKLSTLILEYLNT